VDLLHHPLHLRLVVLGVVVLQEGEVLLHLLLRLRTALVVAGEVLLLRRRTGLVVGAVLRPLHLLLRVVLGSGEEAILLHHLHLLLLLQEGREVETAILLEHRATQGLQLLPLLAEDLVVVDVNWPRKEESLGIRCLFPRWTIALSRPGSSR
jgi:hypothetical protein